MKQVMVLTSICVIAILLVLHPLLFLNDEWITTNQLSQLSQHSQILFNEGKYGTYPNGTPLSYFAERENILSYSSFLPVVSYPFLVLVQLLGDPLPYYASVIFSLVILFLALLLKNNPSSGKWTKPLIGVAFLALLCNLALYRPFQVSGENAPVEILGIVGAHIVAFLLLVLVLYALMKTLFFKRAYILFGLLAVISCSSYFFWTTTCKDHVEVALVLAILILFLIRFIRTTDFWDLFSSFLSCGILCWIRPNYGPVLFLFLLCFACIFIIVHRKNFLNLPYRFFFLAPFGIIPGLVPLLINNYCVTGHPLTFPAQMGTVTSAVFYPSAGAAQSLSAGSPGLLSGLSGIPEMFFSVIHLIVMRITPTVPPETLITNFYTVFISPTTLKVPVLALIPIFVLGLFFLPALVRSRTTPMPDTERFIIIGLLMLVLGTCCAYLTTIGSIDTSLGIYPDIRYLSPVYLPLNIIGLILLSHVLKDSKMIQNICSLTGIITIITCTGMIGLLGILYKYYDFWDVFLWMNGIVTTLMYGTLLSCLLLAFGWYRGFVKIQNLTIPICFLIAFPLIWQVSLVIITSIFANTAYQYPPFLPMIRELIVLIQGLH